jgi:hypothetical protein
MKKSVLVIAYLLSSGLILVSTFAYAAHWHIVNYWCLEEIRYIDLRDWPVPVGCEVIDCCPSCPGADSLDWYIQIQGDLVESLRLEFENLPPDAARKVTTKGKVIRTDKNIFVTKSREAIIYGLPGDMKGRPPVAIPRLVMNEKRLKELMSSDMDADFDYKVSVSIAQKLGPVVVNEYTLEFILGRCYPYNAIHRPQDRVDLDNNTGADRAIVMLTGRRSTGCIGVDREFQNTENIIYIGNMLSNDPCTAESVVFSDDDAMEIISPTTTWTDYRGDELEVDLNPRIMMPVNIVLARAGALADATNDIANADFLYNINNSGIGFNATIQDVSGNAAAVATITGNARCGAANLNDIQGSAYYNANELNAYYVPGGFTASNCVNDRLVVFVGTGANPASLAHEFGHAFSLFGNTTTGGHTNGMAGFGNNNIMWGGGPGTRDHFSVGQAFRFNINNTSSLNTTGVRTDLTRDCPALTTDINCPALALDSLPH